MQSIFLILLLDKNYLIGEGGRISKSKENIVGEGPLQPSALPWSLGDGLTQGFSTGGPRAKSGPPTSLVWPYDHLWNT